MILSVRIKFLVVLASLVFCNAASAESQVVLKTEDFVVTTDDFDRYLAEQGITGEKRRRTLAKDGAVNAVFENIYVVRALASLGEKNPQIDQQEIDWQVENFRDRLLMKRQVSLEVEAEMDAKDWDALALEEYKANKGSYKSDEQVSAAHILISSAERTREEAKARADEVAARLAAGEDFDALVKEYSDDEGSVARGGSLGFFPRNRMVKPFEDAAFAMTQPGDVSDVVETEYGYHIIRFNDRKPAKQLSFDEAKARITQQLKKSLWQQISQARIAAVKSGDVDFGLEVDLPLLEEYEQRYSAGTEKKSPKP